MATMDRQMSFENPCASETAEETEKAKNQTPIEVERILNPTQN